MRLSGILFIYVIIELIGLIVAGRLLGIALTLLIILATGVLGVLILRFAGLSTVIDMRKKMMSGLVKNSNDPMINNLLLGFSGFLLFLPGLIGDLIGLILLIPTVRAHITKLMGVFFIKQTSSMQADFSANFRQTNQDNNSDSNIIEGEWQRKDD